MENTTLYGRLGSTDGIRALVDEIVEAHMNNPVIQARFLPYREKSEELAAVKQHLCNFLEAGSGGPAEYTGRSMPDAHRGMNVSEAEYMAAIDDILLVLQRNGLDDATRNEVLAVAWSLKGEILHV